MEGNYADHGLFPAGDEDLAGAVIAVADGGRPGLTSPRHIVGSYRSLNVLNC